MIEVLLLGVIVEANESLVLLLNEVLWSVGGDSGRGGKGTAIGVALAEGS